MKKERIISSEVGFKHVRPSRTIIKYRIAMVVLGIGLLGFTVFSIYSAIRFLDQLFRQVSPPQSAEVRFKLDEARILLSSPSVSPTPMQSPAPSPSP